VPIRIIGSAILLAALWASVNWIVQAARKPTEMFFPVSGSLAKTPAVTWREYGPLFVKHSTAVITPELLAALAQVEGSGNPVARTYWRWRFSWNPFEVYRPASSAVGMFQITDGTFAEARHYCIHDHVVVEDGRWDNPRSCWFNALYNRVVPSDAVEMTAALLDRTVARTLESNHAASASLQQRQNLAAVIHLCGGGVGNVYVRRDSDSAGASDAAITTSAATSHRSACSSVSSRGCALLPTSNPSSKHHRSPLIAQMARSVQEPEVVT